MDQHDISARDAFLKNNPGGQHLLNLRKSWGWFMAFGALITLCGFFAATYVLMSTLASMLLLGTFMFAGGVFQIIAAFQVWRVKNLFWGWLFSGILFLIACFFAFAWPFQAAMAITILIAISLTASGALRIMAGFQSKGLDGWGWLVGSGVIGIFAAILIATNLPVVALFLPGIILACDLLFQGITMLMMGWALKKGLGR